MEEERLKKELEIEEKGRKEERQHEVFMMQMMGDMFSKVVSNFNNQTSTLTSNEPPNYHGIPRNPSNFKNTGQYVSFLNEGISNEPNQAPNYYADPRSLRNFNNAAQYVRLMNEGINKEPNQAPNYYAHQKNVNNLKKNGQQVSNVNKDKNDGKHYTTL